MNRKDLGSPETLFITIWNYSCSGNNYRFLRHCTDFLKYIMGTGPIVCPKSLQDDEEDRGNTRGNNARSLALLDRFYTTKFMGVGNIPDGGRFPQKFLGTYPYGKSP